MVLAVVVLSIVWAVLLSLAIANNDSCSNFIIGVFEGVVSLVLVLCVFNLCMPDSSKNPSAIDVYRGKTELEVTYRDSIAIDSTVVWKKEYEAVSN